MRAEAVAIVVGQAVGANVKNKFLLFSFGILLTAHWASLMSVTPEEAAVTSEFIRKAATVALSMPAYKSDVEQIWHTINDLKKTLASLQDSVNGINTRLTAVEQKLAPKPPELI
jgi:hypothetical protein